MSIIYTRWDNENGQVTDDFPLPVREVSGGLSVADQIPSMTVREMIARNIDWYTIMAAEGRQFYASDADFDDKLTGQTSFADTTPTLLIRVPAGTVCVPVGVYLGQSGTVAGDTVSVIIGIDNTDIYASGGTAETRFSTRTGPGLPTPQCTVYSTPTATTGLYGTRIMGINLAQDVAPAEGISNEVIWSPTGPDFLVGPASFVVYTFAGTTGPTWFWELKWLEFPLARFGF